MEPVSDQSSQDRPCYICGIYVKLPDSKFSLVCNSDHPKDPGCGQTCHTECAFKEGIIGSATSENFKPLDGSFWCPRCGKVSEILGYWKKLLSIAKDTHSVSVLRQSILLSYRLLDGTSRFNTLHEAVKKMKRKLEKMRPIEGLPPKTGRGAVRKLSVADNVKKLCGNLIKKADKYPENPSYLPPDSRVGPYRPACRFSFQEVTPSTVVIVLVDTPAALPDMVKSYQIWCWKIGKEARPKEPIQSFLTVNRRVTISDLEPSVEYGFRVVSYADTGAFGVSEAKCLTRNPNPCPELSVSSEKTISDIEVTVPSRAKLTVSLDQQFPRDGIEQDRGQLDTPESQEVQHVQPNPITPAICLPDLNQSLTPPSEESQENNILCNLDPAVGVHNKDVSQDIQMNVQEKDCSEESSAKVVNRLPHKMRFDEDDFINCIKLIRWLECKGHIQQEFRMRFLSWFSLNSTEGDKRIIYAFIEALSDEPQSLADQLKDAFPYLISENRNRR